MFIINITFRNYSHLVSVSLKKKSLKIKEGKKINKCQKKQKSLLKKIFSMLKNKKKSPKYIDKKKTGIEV